MKKGLLLLFTQFRRVEKEAQKNPELKPAYIALPVMITAFVIFAKAFTYFMTVKPEGHLNLFTFVAVFTYGLPIMILLCFFLVIECHADAIKRILAEEEARREIRRAVRRERFEKAGYELRELEKIIEKENRKYENS